MKREMELLAPGGDVDSIKAAILAGANAIYCGLDRFNARNRAPNIIFADLHGILRLAHKNNCEVFLTLNIIIIESEIPALIRLLNKLVNTRIDGVIVQDLGLLYLLCHYFPSLNIHASTQLTTHNDGQIKFLNRLKANRVNLSRELTLEEITNLTTTAHANTILTEVFVHGSYCISFSGICYLSSVLNGNSGNRGRCSQPCRDHYLTTDAGKNFPLNLKDNSSYSNLKELDAAGVDSVKIEGRIKKFHYVYTVVNTFRKQLNRLYHGKKLSSDTNDLYLVFNRDFSNGFLLGEIHKKMFIDNPRDHSALHFAEIHGTVTPESLETAKRKLYDLKTEIITDVRRQIEPLQITKPPLTITISGQAGTPLKIVTQTPESVFTVYSDRNLEEADNPKQHINRETILKRFKTFNETEYFIQQVLLEDLQENLFIPFKELTSLKVKILCILNEGFKAIAPIEVPPLNTPNRTTIQPTLSLLISSIDDLHLCQDTAADIYFQLPGGFKNNYAELIHLFTENKRITPWFPSILIGDDFQAAVDFLKHIHPKRIVTNNSGIAYEADQQEISWIAGPHLNNVNSFTLLCLKEHFNCCGAFISNEINRYQIQKIKRPAQFKLFYSIYHPIVLLTSRQCLLHQVTGCKKNQMDTTCIQQCERTSAITNQKRHSLLIKKTKGNYHEIYNEVHFLNTEIATDIQHLFSSFFIDLRGINTSTETPVNKVKLVSLFADHLTGSHEATEKLKSMLQPTTHEQYKRGL